MKSYSFSSFFFPIACLFWAFTFCSCSKDEELVSMYDQEIKNASNDIERFEKEFLVKCNRPNIASFSISDWRMWGGGLSFGFSVKTSSRSFLAPVVDFDGSILGSDMSNVKTMEANFKASSLLNPLSDDKLIQWIGLYRDMLNEKKYPDSYAYKTIPLGIYFIGPYSIQSLNKEYNKSFANKESLVKSLVYSYDGEVLIVSGLNTEDLSNEVVRKNYLIDLHVSIAQIYAVRNKLGKDMIAITGEKVYGYFDLASDDVAIGKGFINKTAFVGPEKDFAETFRFIVTHSNDQISAMRSRNPKLAQKIDFVISTYQNREKFDLNSFKIL